MSAFVRLSFLLLLTLLTACATRGTPDLARLYASQAEDPTQPPVILIHGLMGSTLVDAKSGEQFWPRGLGSLAFSDYADLARYRGADAQRLEPGELVAGLGGVVDYYGALQEALEKVGHFRRGVPGTPVTDTDRRRYYVFVYDWRRDNVETARGLHELIERIRADYADPDLRVDLIAHSNGGLVANYYLRYGAADVLDGHAPFAPTGAGAVRVRRVLLLGTPNLGSATSLYRLQHGMRIGLRTVPVEVLTTFATPFQALPNARSEAVVDVQGKPVALDLFDPDAWRTRQWGAWSADVVERVRASAEEPGAGAAAVSEVQATFARHLVRAGRFQGALAAPFVDPEVEVALFGGDCTLTPARAILVREDGGERLAWSPREVLPQQMGLELTREARARFEALLFEPGDGLVTRASQVGRVRAADGGRPAAIFPLAQSFFLCEEHGQLTANPYFQNNLLNFLLGR